MLVRRLLAFLICLLSLPIAGAPAASDAQLVDRFVALIERDDVSALHKLTLGAVDFSATWRAVITLIDRLDCIEIESVTRELITEAPGERLLRVTIRGTGVTAGAVRREEALPNVWFLRAVPADNEWRIVEIQTAEQRLSAAMIAAASDDERRAMLDPHLNFARLSSLIAYDSAEPDIGERGFAPIRFARDLAAAVGDQNVVQQTKHMESTLHAMLGRNDEAIRIAMESVDESLAIGDPDAISIAWFAAGIAYWGNSDVPSAIDCFRRSAAPADSMANPRLAAKALVNLSYLEAARGNLSGALEAANATAKLSREWGWIQGQIDALLMRASYELRLGNYTAARRTGHEGYELGLKLGRRDKISEALMNLGVEALVRDPDEAIEFFKEVILDDPKATDARIKLAEALAKKHRFAEAIEGYEQGAALAEAEQRFKVAAVVKAQLSYLVQRENPQKALDLARSARQLSSQGSGLKGITSWDIKAAEASALLAVGRTAESEQLYDEVVAEYQAERDSVELAESTHTDFYGRQIGIFHDLIGLKLQRDKTADALRLSELVKASLLDEIQSGERADAGARLTAEERAEQQNIEAEITRLNRELFRAARHEERAAALKTALADARTRWESLETSLHVRDPLEPAHTRMDPLQSPDALVPSSGNIILDYVVMERKTVLFVLTGNDRGGLRIDTHTIDITSADLQRAVDRFLGRLADASFDYEDDARRLYRLLLEPAAKMLQQRNVLVVVPDGPLWRLPFQALQRGDGQPLIAQFTLFYAPSLTSLHRVPKRISPRPTVLAIGNPRFDPGAAEMLRARTRAVLGDLPEAAGEVRQIAQLYGKQRARTLIGRDATEVAIKNQATEYDIVHIAAHAVLDDAQPLYSSIVLASDSGNDGLLEGREITRLHLNARLAVLSACSTAQGQVRPGEGLIALSWAFLVAGCPTVVATQWNVPSESTARLMIDFHRQLASGATVADALRRAQLHLMRDRRYRHPFYWSPFVVVGAGRS